MSEETSTPEATPAKPEVNLSLLASEAFGSNYHGDVRSDPVETPKEEPQEAETQDVELREETPSGEEPQEAQESESKTIDSISELIESNEYDPEWFNTLQVDVKVDGTPSKATLSDLVKSYQIQEAAEKRLEEAKEKAKSQNQALADKQEQVEQSIQVAAKLIQRVESKLTSDFEKVDWDKLESQDPAEWSAKKMKFAERVQELNQMKQEAVSEYQQTKQGQSAEAEQAKQERLIAEKEALLSKIPEWKDPETAKAEDAAICKYLITQGLTQEEVQTASDHRLIVMARKAMLYDQAQGAEPQKKKLAKVPKTLKPGAPKPQAEINQLKQQDATSKLRQSGSIDDAVALLRMRRGNT